MAVSSNFRRGCVVVVIGALSGCAAGGVQAEPTTTPTAAWTRVVVTLRIDPSAPGSLAEVRERLLAQLPGGSHRGLRSYSVIPALALEVSPEGLAALRSSPLVAHVKPDSPERIATDP